MESNMVGWFEIPVGDMDRAKKFYEAVFDVQIHVQDFNELLMGWFPFAEGKSGASGSLVKHPDFYRPSATDGPLVYFSCKDVATPLSRIEKEGGKVLQTKKLISEDVGYMGLFLDSEGNRIALHSRQ
ncbi:VOC family protein [Muriicola marianensis]|uniref:Glyoxalase n=1 Tax=Muriicola marianensis TaxID=1324801 RepID=A0ABQ1R7W8_9FLAO|nr:VOC family protein [Muriicola marianensis]GGD59128.1 glyoxalase [Muriicola marianensis]